MTRRLAREIAMKTIFAGDLGNEASKETLRQLCQESGVSSGANIFSNLLVDGVWTHQFFLDGLIGEYAQEWDLERIAAVDRSILRMALFEMVYLEEIPVAVIINEALEIAKIYSGEEAPRFLNGILGKVIDFLPQIRNQAKIKEEKG